MTAKVPAGKSKTRKIEQSDRPKIFFWVSYEVSHQKRTWAEKILWRDGVEILAQTVITIVQNAIVEED